MSSSLPLASQDVPRPSLRVIAPRWVGWGPSVRQVEISLYLLAASGLLLWEPLGLPWSIAAPVLVAHVVGGSVLTVAVISPFWIRHRRRLKTSRKTSRKLSGRAIEASLLLLIGSGVFLFVHGNPGGTSGRISAELHLWLTLPLVGLLVWHMAPWSVFQQLGRALTRRLARPGRTLA